MKYKQIVKAYETATDLKKKSLRTISRTETEIEATKRIIDSQLDRLKSLKLDLGVAQGVYGEACHDVEQFKSDYNEAKGLLAMDTKLQKKIDKIKHEMKVVEDWHRLK